MKKIYFLITLLLFLAGSGSIVNAQVLAWDFNTNLGNEVTVNATTQNANLSISSVSRGPGLLVSALANSYSSTDFSLNGTFTDATTNGDYLQFAVNAVAGFKVSLSTLDANFRRSGTGPNTFQWQYSLDGFATAGVNIGAAISYTLNPTNGTAQTPIDLSVIAALQNVLNTTTVTFRLYGYGATATGGTFALGRLAGNDLAIGGTVASVTSNTITPTTLTGAPFNLANCSATATGTIAFTSTGTFNAGNTYTAQLSDALGSFAAPVTIGSLLSTANAGTISITIPAGTVSGVAYAIQIVSSNPVVTSTTSGAFTINQSGSCTSNTTDYFRSKATGNWAATSTWESSPDNATWINATLSPTSAANTITIRNGHTVTVAADANMDQVIIQSGGILLHSSNVLTVNDGAGDDIIIQSGGYFTLSSASNPPVFSPITASANVNTGGALRVTAGGMTGVAAGVNASNYIYQNASELEMNTAFSTSNVTYFPNVDAVTIPIMKTTTNLVVGSGNPTVVNGIFEAAGGTITFQNAGTKTFRNGITGVSDVNGSTSGKFIINGITASLGGAGLLTLPAAGLDIGTTSTVTMISDKSISGNIALLTDAYVQLGIYNLTVTGSITGGAINAHIVTVNTGLLTMKNVLSAGSAVFPIGPSTTTYNPLTITNNDAGPIDFSARVEIGITPAIGYPAKAVNRTWTIKPSTTPSSADVIFEYSGTDGNAGFNYASPLELGQYIAGAWNVIKTGIVPTGSYQANVIGITSFAGGTASPFVLGNLASVLAFDGVSVNYFTGVKQNGTHILNWKISCNNTPSVTINLQRSADTRNFVSINSINATAVRCDQPFNYTDAQPLPGINYYRLKIVDADGKVTYSNIIALINGSKGFALMNIAPNPVTGNSFKLNTTSATSTKMQLVISDMQGRVVNRQAISLIAGFNSTDINVSNLASGTYNLYGMTTEEKTAVVRLVKQ